MVKSVENGVSLPPFLVKCYEMVNDESTDELISWSESNDSFIIWDESRFSSQLLPKYFKHSNFSSFVRQLNIYGFRKIDTEQWEFASEFFRKDEKYLLKSMSRRKQGQRKQMEEERRVTGLWKEVETLKTDKVGLSQELKMLKQHQQMSRSKMVLLKEQLKGMEKNQQQMLSFIVLAMQSPEFMLQFFQPKENNTWHVSEDGTIVRYGEVGPMADELMGLDFSSDEIRDLFMDIDVLLGEGKGSVAMESLGDFVLPGADESDGMLEQLLLPYPSGGFSDPKLIGLSKNSGDDVRAALVEKTSVVEIKRS